MPIRITCWLRSLKRRARWIGIDEYKIAIELEPGNKKYQYDYKNALHKKRKSVLLFYGSSPIVG
mgnify:CR=1 FL=1